MRYSVRALLLAGICLPLGGSVMSQTTEERVGYNETERLARSFDLTPPTAENIASRQEAFRAVDRLVDDMLRKDWCQYLKHVEHAASERAKAQEMEFNFEVARFISLRLRQAIERIRERDVAPGCIAVTYVYNMGFVVETPEVALGVDLSGPYVDELAGALDALTVSHPHPDHISDPLISAMHARNKPVYTAKCVWWDQTPYRDCVTRLAQGESVFVGPLRITAHIGDHYPLSYTRFNEGRIKPATNNMFNALIETDALSKNGNFLLYHVGDDFNKQSMLDGAQGRVVDVFLGRGCPDPSRWENPKKKDAGRWRDLNESIGDPVGVVQVLNPRLFLPGHMAEMGHDKIVGGCTPFTDAFGVASVLPPSQSAVLMWGERVLLRKGGAGEIKWQR